ncbi:topoisomerase [Streptomyces cinereoruber]|uniref:topoisomerase n=1 Tax=Streptomyces cinereoruber TaxID=67260 RepID=UPI00364B0C0C
MQTLSNEQRTFFETAVSTYQADLAADTSAQAYLMSRGFGPEVAAQFRLGVVTSPQVGHERFQGRLAIPYITPNGVVNIRFRCLKQHVCKDEGCPKYLSIPGMGTNLYNVLDLKKDSLHVGVEEGEVDTITLSICGIPAVGLPGVKAWQKWFGRCLSDFDVVYSLGDGDRAGAEFNDFMSREVKARPITLPKGMDVNSIYMEGGADAVRRLLQS